MANPFLRSALRICCRAADSHPHDTPKHGLMPVIRSDQVRRNQYQAGGAVSAAWLAARWHHRQNLPAHPDKALSRSFSRAWSEAGESGAGGSATDCDGAVRRRETNFPRLTADRAENGADAARSRIAAASEAGLVWRNIPSHQTFGPRTADCQQQVARRRGGVASGRKLTAPGGREWCISWRGCSPRQTSPVPWHSR
jgi:hypothetical protein